MRQDERLSRPRRVNSTVKHAKKRRQSMTPIFIAFLIPVLFLLGVSRLSAVLNETETQILTGGGLTPTHREPFTGHYISWEFYVYHEPHFKAERVTRLSSQTVNILYENVYGWALVETYRGEYWAYLRANRKFISRTMGLFANKGAPYMSGYIKAQTVYILREEGNWLHIETEQGAWWIDFNATPPTYALDELLKRHGDDISVFFENIETGFVYRFNADRVYFSASVPKASYALYVYQLAEQGLVDLDSVHTFTSADAMGGSGIIFHQYPLGTRFTLRELLRLNLSESDNSATLMLRRIHGLDGYRRFLEAMGGNPDFVGDRIMNSDLTANEAGLFAREIFAYIESGGRYSEEFKAALLDNQFPFIVSDYPVASKTGWTRPIAWHDMAIVYAPSPFILVILSARNGWSDADYADFAEISMAFQRFNDKWFVN